MKHTVRPLLGILFLMVVVAVVSFCGHHGTIHPEDEIPCVKTAKIASFNETLLKYASIDLRESMWELDIKDLLKRKPPGLSLFLAPHSTEKIHRVWLSFQKHFPEWYRNRRFQPDIILELVSLVKTPMDGKNIAPSGTKYKSCAVVGNSGILLNTEYGEFIDSHEAVIRLNNARIESFEANVGKKTSIFFVNGLVLRSCALKPVCSCHPYGPDVPIVAYISHPSKFFYYLACKTSQDAPLVITDARFDVLCARIVKYYSIKRFVETTEKEPEEWAKVRGTLFCYSSGMQAVMLAVGICDGVSLFGFGKSADAKHHYHTNQVAESYVHDYEAEYDFYRDLVARPQLIPFFSDEFKFPPVALYRQHVSAT